MQIFPVSMIVHTLQLCTTLITDADEIRIVGCYIAWVFRGQSKSEFIHSNRTQTGLYLQSRD